MPAKLSGTGLIHFPSSLPDDGSNHNKVNRRLTAVGLIHPKLG